MTADTRAVRGRVVTPDSVVDDGTVVLEGGLIAWVGPAEAVPQRWRAAVADARPRPQGYVLPGLVDIHCHGGGGQSFPDATDMAAARTAIDEHRRHGTTSLVASLVTADPATLLERTALLTELAAAGELAAIHLEGPFIAHDRCGAQNPAAIQEPDPVLTAQLLEVAGGHIATMTIAPEREGAREVVQVLIEHGALPSFGHTVTAAARAREAVAEAHALLAEAGAARSAKATVTHLFNGMNPMHHREPGPIPEFLAAARAGRLVLELINDGTHIDPGLARNVIELVGRENVVLVTDAMAATGMADGQYELGSLDVTVTDGVARLTDGGSIAGGTAHLHDVLRTTVAGGVDLVDACYVAATNPAAVLGRSDIGALEPGRRADVLLLDDALGIEQVIRGGEAL